MFEITCLVTGFLGTDTYIIRTPSFSGGADFVFVVDAGGTGTDGSRIEKFLKEKNYTPSAFVFTHGHFDHVSSLAYLHKCWPDAEIAIHKADSFYLGKTRNGIATILANFLCSPPVVIFFVGIELLITTTDCQMLPLKNKESPVALVLGILMPIGGIFLFFITIQFYMLQL